MTAPAQRLRSVLYVPGANERALEKARGLAADALILDLEDSVAPGAKPQARERVCELVRSNAYQARPVAVRINAVDTNWHGDDLAAVALAAPTAVVVPKVQSADDVVAVERALLSTGEVGTQIWAMLETPLAVLRALEIATSSERLRLLLMGNNDLAAELHAPDASDRGPLATSIGLCLLAARGSGRQILDGVYNHVSDPAGFEAECLAARRAGFDGKTLIHPGQVEACNRAFSPSQHELEQARRVIEVFAQASQAGSGVATLDGRLIESLDVDSAQRVLANARAEDASIQVDD